MPSYPSFDGSRWKKAAAGVVVVGGAGWWLATGGIVSPSGLPSCTITHPAPTGAALSGSVSLSATCDSTPASVTFEVDGPTVVGTDSSAPFSASWDSTAIANGAHTLDVLTTDANGNTRRSASVSITTSNGTPQTANEWVNTVAGASPSRCSSPCAYDPVHAYGTKATAYTAASVGDTIDIQGGSYPAETLPYSIAKADGLGTCDYMAGMTDTSSTPSPVYTGCITFQPATGATPTFAGITLQVDYVRLRNLNLTGTLALGGSAPLNGQLCSSIRQHDLVADGITDTGGVFGIKADHASIINSTFNIGDAYRADNGTSHISTCLDGAGTSSRNGNFEALVGNTIENLLQTQVSGQSGATSYQLMHLEAVHLEAGNHVLVNGNTFKNNGGHNLFAEAEGNLGAVNSSDWRITNNFFDTICSGQNTASLARTGTLTSGSAVITGLSQTSDLTVGETVASIYLPQGTTIISKDSSSQITVSGNALASGAKSLELGGTCQDQGGDAVFAQDDTLTDAVFSFNTFRTGVPAWPSNGPSGSESGILESVGNISGSALSAGNCTTYKAAAATIYDYNVWASGSTCGTHDAVGAVSFVNAAIADLHLTGIAGTADNLVPTTVTGGCPPFDIDGNSRPHDANCDAGADER